MAIAERLSTISWIPSWIEHQHYARYEWVQQYTNGKIVIDAACGTGYGTAMIAKNASSAVGYDCSDDAIEEATRLFGDSTARFECADITKLPVPDNSFDVYVSFETIEHIDADGKYLSEASRVLKQDGLFICSTPNRHITNPHTTVGDNPFNPHHVREYTAGELQPILESHFDSVEWYGQTFYSKSWEYWLGATARVHPLLAVRCHQARKAVVSPFDKKACHMPQPTNLSKAPEFLVAVCRM